MLHIIPTLRSGGAEKMLVDILEEMNKYGVKSEVLVLTKEKDFYSEKILDMGIRFILGKQINSIIHLI